MVAVVPRFTSRECALGCSHCALARVARPDSGSSSDGTTVPLPALIDVNLCNGIQFWLWASPDTVAEVYSNLAVSLIDKNELQGGGVLLQRPTHDAVGSSLTEPRASGQATRHAAARSGCTPISR